MWWTKFIGWHAGQNLARLSPSPTPGMSIWTFSMLIFHVTMMTLTSLAKSQEWTMMNKVTTTMRNTYQATIPIPTVSHPTVTVKRTMMKQKSLKMMMQGKTMKPQEWQQKKMMMKSQEWQPKFQEWQSMPSQTQARPQEWQLKSQEWQSMSSQTQARPKEKYSTPSQTQVMMPQMTSVQTRDITYVVSRAWNIGICSM